MRSNSRPRARAIDWPRLVLPTPGGPTKQRIGPGRLRVQLADGQVLEDPVLDVLEVVVVCVQDLLRVLDVEVVLGLHRPGQVDQPLEVAADDAVLGRGRRKLLQAPELALGRLRGVLRQLRGLDPLAELVHLGGLVVGLAELVLDRLHLLAQEVLALALVDLGLDLGLDLGSEADHLELAREDLGEAAEPLRDVELLEQALLLLDRDPQRAGDQVAERRGVVEVGDRELELLGQVGDLLDDLAEGVLDVPGQRLELGARRRPRRPSARRSRRGRASR